MTGMAQTAYDDAVSRQWASQYANWAQAPANNNTIGSTFGDALPGAGIGALAGGGRVLQSAPARVRSRAPSLVVRERRVPAISGPAQ
jgi:hypothetical protein